MKKEIIFYKNFTVSITNKKKYYSAKKIKSLLLNLNDSECYLRMKFNYRPI